jgi:hypothetical protein
MITVWPGRVLCVWRDGKLIDQHRLDERTARELIRAILAGWDETPVQTHQPRDGLREADV